MESIFQKTLKNEIFLRGRGLHTGLECGLRICPLNAGSGVIFFSEDMAPTMPIPASWRFVRDVCHNVTLGREGVRIRTVEHLLSALAILGVDNCAIHVTGGEVPLLGGAAQEFLDAIDAAGTILFPGKRTVLRLSRPVWIDQGERYLLALPCEDFRVSCSIEFANKAIGYQACHFVVDEEVYRRGIARARTFGFAEDLEWMRERGLALGGDYDSVLLYAKDGSVKTEPRYADECARHKVLDMIGDLSLLGSPLRAHIIGHKIGHSLSVALAEKIALSGDARDSAMQEFCGSAQP
ncbi:MAG: UDP-3-O-acyl-N-acetylglucosamine deacetylase [Spirochaetota bacterium]|nr:UDP-3-O-acyl-N-acetylglucosamine deacetylase [Spirochaetota bacterium]